MHAKKSNISFISIYISIIAAPVMAFFVCNVFFVCLYNMISFCEKEFVPSVSLFTPYLNVRVRLMPKAKLGQAIACNPIRRIRCPAEGSEEPPPIMKSLGQLMLLMCEKEMSVN